MRRALFGLAILMPACASPPPPPAPDQPQAAPYVARGNEPFWRLDVTETGALWRTPEAERAADAPAIAAPTPIVPGWRGLSARFSGAPLTAEIRPSVCQDSMSGQSYPDTVTVTFERQTYTGCGGDPLQLLTGRWRLDTLFGLPALTGRETAMLEISDTGRLSGATGCNRIFATLNVTGEGLAITGIGATRMACLNNDVATQEARMLEGLESVQAFRIAADGRLVLQAGAFGDMIFTRSDAP